MRTDAFVWEIDRRQDEFIAAVEDDKVQFILTLKRNPFEIRLHLRTRDRDIGLVRVDNAPYHPNPDGTEIRNQPHMHVYREGFDLAWAQPITWYDVNDPLRTLERFLEEVRTSFPSGLQLAIL
ncbi:MAG TPA: hypothetical protein VGF13_17050 [Verrucomicrobiae bacterium]